MKWLLVVVAVIAALILAVVVIGTLLPKEHTATRAARFKEPPSVIWQAITDYDKFPEWRRSVARVEPLPPVNGKPSWAEYDKHGDRIPFEIVELAPPQRLVARIADPNLPFGGAWTYEITPANGGSTLRISENGEVRNPVFRFVSRFVIGHHATIDEYLKALGAKFGENVTLEN